MTVVLRHVFYLRIPISPTDYPSTPQIEIPFTAQRLIIANESDSLGIGWSFDRSSLHGELFKKEAPIVFDGLEINKIWFKKLSGATNPFVRVWAWRKIDV